MMFLQMVKHLGFRHIICLYCQVLTWNEPVLILYIARLNIDM